MEMTEKAARIVNDAIRENEPFDYDFIEEIRSTYTRPERFAWAKEICETFSLSDDTDEDVKLAAASLCGHLFGD